MSNKKNNNKGNDYQARTRDTDRLPRKKTYAPVRETAIPVEVQDKFRKEGYELRYIRWSINGQEDTRCLSRRANEGYEFVTRAELEKIAPTFAHTFQERNVSVAPNGVLIVGDNCLVKIDVELREDRREYYRGIAQNELESVDANVISKKKGLLNNDSSTKVSTREPTFSN